MVKFILLLTGIFLLNTAFVYAENTGEYLQVGNDFLNAGNFDMAIIEYTKALDINPNLAKAYDNRGVAYAQEGSLSRAIADFTMAIANNFNDAEAYNNRGHAYAAKGNLPQAIADYGRSIDIDSLYTKAYKNRAIAYYKLKEYDRAWGDVFKVEELGGHVDHDFYRELSKVSGQVK